MSIKKATLAGVAEEEKADTVLSVSSANPATTKLKASDIFSHVETLYLDDLILYARASTQAQANKGNLTDQIATLRRYANTAGFNIIAEFTDIGPGSHFETNAGLRKAVQLGKRTGATILAETTDRYLRPKGFNPKIRSTHVEPNYERFRIFAKTVTFATLEKPDSKRARSAQTKRGIEEKGINLGGDHLPGWQIRRMYRIKPLVCRLRFDEQMGYGQILTIVNAKCEGIGFKTITKQTVKRWCAEG